MKKIKELNPKLKATIILVLISLVTFPIVFFRPIENSFLSNALGLEFTGKSEDFFEQSDRSEILGEATQSETFIESESQLDEHITHKIPADIEEIYLDWQYYYDYDSEDFISGTTILRLKDFDAQFHTSDDSQYAKMTFDEKIANYVMGDILKQSESAWYERVEGAYKILIENSKLILKIDFSGTDYSGWWTLMNDASIVMNLVDKPSRLIEFEALMVGDDVYKVKEGSEMAEAIDIIVSGCNKTLTSIELRIDGEIYTVAQTKVNSNSISLIFARR
ncbi:hypothetical protein JW766_02980 [Candidatus Dojkabacteria bacterium]|nr:hypothetical protein [Candidatus Dojkabacteria bacterium]